MATRGAARREAFGDALSQRIQHERFAVVGISCWLSSQYLGVRWLANLVRQALPNSYIVVGGTHATAVSEDFLGPDSPFDLVVTGQAEATLHGVEPCRRPGPRRVRLPETRG